MGFAAIIAGVTLGLSPGGAPHREVVTDTALPAQVAAHVAGAPGGACVAGGCRARLRLVPVSGPPRAAGPATASDLFAAAGNARHVLRETRRLSVLKLGGAAIEVATVRRRTSDLGGSVRGIDNGRIDTAFIGDLSLVPWSSGGRSVALAVDVSRHGDRLDGIADARASGSSAMGVRIAWRSPRFMADAGAFHVDGTRWLNPAARPPVAVNDGTGPGEDGFRGAMVWAPAGLDRDGWRFKLDARRANLDPRDPRTRLIDGHDDTLARLGVSKTF